MSDDQPLHKAPTSALPPTLTRRCRQCRSLFETRCYTFEHCVRCSLHNLAAHATRAEEAGDSAGESAWEAQQRRRMEAILREHAETVRRQAGASAQAAQKQRRLRQATQWGCALLCVLAVAWLLVEGGQW